MNPQGNEFDRKCMSTETKVMQCSMRKINRSFANQVAVQ